MIPASQRTGLDVRDLMAQAMRPRTRAAQLEATPPTVTAWMGRPATEFQTAQIVDVVRRLQTQLAAMLPTALPAPAPAVGSPAAMAERIALFKLAWAAYESLMGAAPADKLPTPFPFGIPRAQLIGIRLVRSDVPPALARMLERILTAPPRAELQTVRELLAALRELDPFDAFEEPARRPFGAPGLHETVATTDGLAARLPPRADVSRPVGVVAAHLKSLLTELELTTAGAPRLASGAPVPARDRAALFRVGWAGYELLTARAPYQRVAPYTLVLGHDEPLTPVLSLRPDTPEPLADVVERLLATDHHSAPLAARDVAIALRHALDEAGHPSPSSTSARWTPSDDLAALLTADGHAAIGNALVPAKPRALAVIVEGGESTRLSARAREAFARPAAARAQRRAFNRGILIGLGVGVLVAVAAWLVR